MFAILMDVVSGDVMYGLLFETLYADDLFLMAESVEELQLNFDRWKNVIEKKGLKYIWISKGNSEWGRW